MGFPGALERVLCGSEGWFWALGSASGEDSIHQAHTLLPAPSIIVTHPRIAQCHPAPVDKPDTAVQSKIAWMWLVVVANGWAEEVGALRAFLGSVLRRGDDVGGGDGRDFDIRQAYRLDSVSDGGRGGHPHVRAIVAVECGAIWRAGDAQKSFHPTHVLQS